MSTTVRRLVILGALAPLGCILAMSRPASADKFGRSHYDRATDELVVTLSTAPGFSFEVMIPQ
jgi:hypothetical protein